MAVFPIVEEYVEKFVILNEIGQWESFRTEERIVRCKDCKFCRKAKCPTSIDIYLCVKNGVDKTYAPGVFVKADGFCAWARQKEVE